MKVLYLLPLFAALLVAGCGEKSSSEGSDSAGASAEPSADAAKPSPAEPPVAKPQSEAPSDTPNSLSDADIERLLKEAVDVYESLEERDDLIFQDNKPYSGWVKELYDSGQVQLLAQAKDGKPDGPYTLWHENGQKMYESTFKDGEPISEKWWNAKGKEVETEEEALHE